MTNIDLDKQRIVMCIEFLPETESTERMVIISINGEMGMPTIRKIDLAAFTPIPLPIAEIVQDYAASLLVLPVQTETVKPEKEIIKTPIVSSQMTLL
jgi:hypothetical protein